MPSRPVNKSVFDAMCRCVAESMRQLSQVENKRSVILPEYDKDNFPANAKQGEIALADPTSLDGDGEPDLAAHAYGTLSHTNPEGTGEHAECPFSTTSIDNVDTYITGSESRYVITIPGIYAFTLEGTLSATTEHATGMWASIAFTIGPSGGDITDLSTGAVSISDTRTLVEGCHVTVGIQNYDAATFIGDSVSFTGTFTMDLVP